MRWNIPLKLNPCLYNRLMEYFISINAILDLQELSFCVDIKFVSIRVLSLMYCV